MKLTKTDVPNYFKTEKGVVINTNDGELTQYLLKRTAKRKLAENEERFESIEKQVEGLNSKLDLILEKLK